MALKYKTSAVLEWLIFSALLGVATLFVWSVLTEYSAGKTYFSEPEFADIGQDAPTITLCWSAGLKLVYGKDYEWRVQHDGKFNTLHQGNNYVAFNEPVTNKSSQRMIYLRELMINYQDTDDNEFVMKPSCSSIGQDITSPGLTQDIWPFLGRFLVRPVGNKDLNEAFNVTEATLYFTTEENSYGVVMDRWFDGMPGEFKLIKGRTHFIKIIGVRRYEYLKSKCTHETFYQCLATRMNSSKRCLKYEDPCTPWSLPGRKPLEEFPLCKSPESVDCNKKLFLELYYGGKCKERERKEKKTCFVQEYSVEERNIKVQKQRGFNFQFFVQYGEPKYSRGYREDRPRIKVYKENLVWSELELLGNIGGQLGMFIGFSFSGCLIWMTNGLIQFCSNLLIKKCMTKNK